MKLGLKIRIVGRGGGISPAAFWASLISATVEDAAPTKVVMTFDKSNTDLVATDFTIAGKTITLLERDATNKILTLTVSVAFEYGDTPVVTFVLTGTTANVTNNISDPYGPELIENITFDDNTWWNLGAGWSISDGTANTSGGWNTLNKTDIVTEGKTYKCRFTIKNYTQGEIFCFLGSSAGRGTTRSADGTYEENITASGEFGTIIGFISDMVSFVGSIDDVSLKEVL